MDISAEREEIIRQFNMVHDVDLIKAIKSLLDFGLHKQTDDDSALNASIDRAINDSKNGSVRPYEEFMAEVRKRYQA
jgi:hypothetical protein